MKNIGFNQSWRISTFTLYCAVRFLHYLLLYVSTQLHFTGMYRCFLLLVAVQTRIYMKKIQYSYCIYSQVCNIHTLS